LKRLHYLPDYALAELQRLLIDSLYHCLPVVGRWRLNLSCSQLCKASLEVVFAILSISNSRLNYDQNHHLYCIGSVMRQKKWLDSPTTNANHLSQYLCRRCWNLNNDRNLTSGTPFQARLQSLKWTQPRPNPALRIPLFSSRNCDLLNSSDLNSYQRITGDRAPLRSRKVPWLWQIVNWLPHGSGEVPRTEDSVVLSLWQRPLLLKPSHKRKRIQEILACCFEVPIRVTGYSTNYHSQIFDW
jgi:hypothetical protein